MFHSLHCIAYQRFKLLEGQILSYYNSFSINYSAFDVVFTGGIHETFPGINIIFGRPFVQWFPTFFPLCSRREYELQK